MAPADGPLPPAQPTDATDPAERARDGVPVAANVAEHVVAMSNRNVLFLRAGLWAIELLPFPWRLSKAPPAEREAVLRRLERSRWVIFHDLLLMVKSMTGAGYARDPRVASAIGYSIRCETADPATVPPDALGDTRPAGDGAECDFAIVGSGAGGAAAAVALAEAGHDVLVLEAGPHQRAGGGAGMKGAGGAAGEGTVPLRGTVPGLSPDPYPPDPVSAAAAIYRDAGLTFAEGSPLIPIPVGRVVGGTTVINSGTCLWPKASLFGEWEAERGINWAPGLAGRAAEVEEMLAVATPSLESIGRNGQLVAEGAAALGYSGHVLPRNAGACTQCSGCPAGCPAEAKRGVHVSYLPRAVAAGARVLAGVEAGRIIFERRRAIGLECQVVRPRRGPGESPSPARKFTVRARKGVICAGGAFGTPELLLRSGVRHPELGKHLRIQPAIWVGARFDEPVRGWEGIMQSYKVDQFADEGVMMEATFTPLAMATQWLPGVGHAHQARLEGFELIGSNGVHIHDRSEGRVSLGPGGRTRISYALSDDDRKRFAFGVARAAEIWFAAGATEVYPQIRGNPILFPGQEQRFERRPPAAAEMRLEAFHPMGTTRLDASERRGVVGLDGEVRGHESLYVADASVLPTALGVNPMLTIIAAASEIGERIAGRHS